jgi:DNA-binding transcriptional regulator LsrR (DeoR family)
VPGKRVFMRKTREVLRLYFELKLGQRQIARSANVSQSTVHDYVTRFRAASELAAAARDVGPFCATSPFLAQGTKIVYAHQERHGDGPRRWGT